MCDEYGVCACDRSDTLYGQLFQNMGCFLILFLFTLVLQQQIANETIEACQLEQCGLFLHLHFGFRVSQSAFGGTPLPHLLETWSKALPTCRISTF